MSKYSISVVNESGYDQNIAIYQTYPDLTQGLPLVWLLQTINADNHTTYEWDIDWALNWGTSSQPLHPGVKYTSGGKSQAMNPTGAGGNNCMGVTFSGTQFKTDPLAYHDPDVLPGRMKVTTDQSFTTAQAEKMSIAVYMNSLPAFAMQGKPNGTYMFDTHPVYYICTTYSKQGVAVSGDYVSNATEICFKNGVTSLNFKLTNTLEFIEVK